MIDSLGRGKSVDEVFAVGGRRGDNSRRWRIYARILGLSKREPEHVWTTRIGRRSMGRRVPMVGKAAASDLRGEFAGTASRNDGEGACRFPRRGRRAAMPAQSVVLLARGRA